MPCPRVPLRGIEVDGITFPDTPCPRVPLGGATPAYGGGVWFPSWGGVAPWVYRIRTGASSSHETSRMRRTSRRCDVQAACWRGLRSGVHRGATIFRKLSENFRGVHRNGCLHNNCQHQLIRSRSSSRQLNPFFFSLLSRPGGQPHRGSFLFGRLRCRMCRRRRYLMIWGLLAHLRD